MIELRAAHPIVKFGLFRNAIVTVAISTAFLVLAAMFGATLFIPLFVHSVLGSSATSSGTILMPLTLSLLLTAIVAAQGITRTGRYRPFAIVGAASSAIGAYLLTTMEASTHYAVLVRNVAIVGIGLGASIPVFNLTVQNAVEARVLAAATSMVQFVRAIGGTLGIAVLGSFLTNGFSPAFRHFLPGDVLSQVSPARLDILSGAQLFRREATGDSSVTLWLELRRYIQRRPPSRAHRDGRIAARRLRHRDRAAGLRNGSHALSQRYSAAPEQARVGVG